MSKPDYDTTLARIAGNIAAGLVNVPDVAVTRQSIDGIAFTAVSLAEEIVKRCKQCAALPRDDDGT